MPQIVHMPMGQDAVLAARLLAVSAEAADPMLEEVEALLRGGRMNDPASLAFAVEAYRTAIRYGHPDEARMDRLEELEQRLARLASR
jgi:TPR repeat protein